MPISIGLLNFFMTAQIQQQYIKMLLKIANLLEPYRRTLLLLHEQKSPIRYWFRFYKLCRKSNVSILSNRTVLNNYMVEQILKFLACTNLKLTFNKRLLYQENISPSTKTVFGMMCKRQFQTHVRL